jgi:hypothetical protein
MRYSLEKSRRKNITISMGTILPNGRGRLGIKCGKEGM